MPRQSFGFSVPCFKCVQGYQTLTVFNVIFCISHFRFYSSNLSKFKFLLQTFDNKAVKVIAIFKTFKILRTGNDHEVEFHEIEIQLFHEIEIMIMRLKLDLIMRSKLGLNVWQI
jgi:hypothetical protein